MPSKRTIPRTCEACGKDFLAYPDQVKRGGGKFCSRSCANRTLAVVQQGKNHPGYKGGTTVVPRTCERCGATFVSKPSDVKRGNGRYCSLECQRAAIYAARVVRHEHVMANFWSLLDQSGGPESCWKWTGKRDKNGYGRIFNELTHRIAYELAHGSIPDGKDILHSCDNPPCCNPAHLHPGTQKQNVEEMIKRQRNRVGEAHPGSKLTWDDVRTIRARYADGEPQSVIAAHSGVSQGAVSKIIRNVTWKESP